MGLGTAFSVVGTSVGFRLAWGPIFWGLVSAIIGFILGVLIRVYTEVILRKRKPLQGKKCRDYSHYRLHRNAGRDGGTYPLGAFCGRGGEGEIK